MISPEQTIFPGLTLQVPFDMNDIVNLTVATVLVCICNPVWHKAIQPKKWLENFPAIKIALLFMA